jgi:riboflavin synthase
MFTGIIECFGTIKEVSFSSQGRRLQIESDVVFDETKIGDSICVSGACLTVVERNGKNFKVDMSPETYGLTTFSKTKAGQRVNLERALRFSDRIDGHLVSGHVDGIGTITHKAKSANAIIVSISVPGSLSRYMIKKGSVALDGISLTINKCFPGSFEVSIIPHTAMLTTIGFKKAGDDVNIETDMIGKYVEQFLTKGSDKDKNSSMSKINMEFLSRTGFLGSYRR